jgi:hypothetical protein
MTAGIERYSVVAGLAEGLSSTFPGVAGLTTTVLKDDKRSVWVTPRIPGDRETSGPNPGVHRYRCSW